MENLILVDSNILIHPLGDESPKSPEAKNF